MDRQMIGAQIALISVLVLQMLLLALHDSVPLGRWNNLHQLKTSVLLPKRILATFINTALGVVPLVLMFAHFLAKPHVWQRSSSIAILAFLFLGELLSWWKPYFFGADSSYVDKIRPVWEGTFAFLPERHGIKPNTLHCILHGLTLTALVFTIVV